MWWCYAIPVTTGNSEGTHFRSGDRGAEVVHPRSSTESLPLGFHGHSLLPEMAAVTGHLKVIMQSDAFITIVGRQHQQEADLSSQVAAIWGLSEAAV